MNPPKVESALLSYEPLKKTKKTHATSIILHPSHTTHTHHERRHHDHIRRRRRRRYDACCYDYDSYSYHDDDNRTPAKPQKETRPPRLSPQPPALPLQSVRRRGHLSPQPPDLALQSLQSSDGKQNAKHVPPQPPSLLLPRLRRRGHVPSPSGQSASNVSCVQPLFTHSKTAGGKTRIKNQGESLNRAYFAAPPHRCRNSPCRVTVAPHL
jgi:hypothetical protein